MTQPLALDLHADALAAVSLAKSTEKIRHYLQGVYVTPWRVAGVDGVMMVATNRHILAAYFDDRGSANRHAIIGADFTAAALRTPASEKTTRRLVVSGDTGRVMRVGRHDSQPATAALMLVTEIDGTFPAWPKVIPNAPTAPGPAFFTWSPFIMAQVCKIAQRLHGSKLVGMNGFQSADGEPALFTFGSGSPLVVVAMPMRGSTRATDDRGFRFLSGDPTSATPPRAETLAAE